MNNFIKLKKRIRKNEGFRNFCYSDKLGYKTIGYGHLIKSNEKNFLKEKFSKKYLLNLFELDFKKAYHDYKKNYKNKNHLKFIQEIYIEMIFQLGIKKQKKFIKMNKCIDSSNFYMAALEMKNSRWYQQTPKRVESLIKILLKK